MSQKYRKGIGIFLLNEKNKLWVGKRIDYKNKYWQMPQGGIDDLESPLNAMKRELFEETGLKESYEVIGKTSKWLTYNLPRDIVNVVWDGKFIGQKQIWFACRFKGEDDQIDINRFKNPEFCEWMWIDPSEILKLVVPFKKKLYIKVLSQFKSFII